MSNEIKCPKCGTELPSNSEFCNKCGNKIISTVNTNPKSTKNKTIGCLITFAVLIILIIIGFKACCNWVNESSEATRAHESAEFQKQMNQDPSTWNKEQRDRYNNFANWEADQQNNK